MQNLLAFYSRDQIPSFSNPWLKFVSVLILACHQKYMDWQVWLGILIVHHYSLEVGVLVDLFCIPWVWNCRQ